MAATVADVSSTPDPAADVMIQRALDAAREVTGLDLAYVTEFLDGTQQFRGLDGDAASFGLDLETAIPLDGTYCQRMLDGRLGNVVPDTADDPVTSVMPATADADVGAYVGVPLRLPDGRLYGSLCAISHSAEPGLNERHVGLMKMFARLIGDQIAQLQEAASTQRAQNEFLASVSHDLRSPLIAVANLAEDLATGHPDVDPSEAGKLIEQEARRVLAMVDDVMLVTRQRAGELTLERVPVDLVEIARVGAQAATLAAGGDGARIRASLPDEPLIALADGGRIRQALQNLLENAVKYSPAGGPVELRVFLDGSVVLEVEDHGIGVSEDDQARLGERFFRASSAADLGITGIGLGLATTRAIVDLHEGTLSVRSVPGVGSTFTVRLPRERAA